MMITTAPSGIGCRPILHDNGTYRSGYTRAKVSWSGVPWTLTAAAWDRARLRRGAGAVSGNA